MSDKKVIMWDSPEAATLKTVEGWVSRKGRFFGKDERTARYDGSTHRACEECGTVYETNSFCRPCSEAKRSKVFWSLPVEKWDGVTPLVLFDDDKYFFGEDILDYLSELPKDEEVRICKCEPMHLHLLDSDTWCDDLPSDGDGELPTEVGKALNALNAAIKNAGPVAWTETNIAIDVDDLRSRIPTEDK